MYILQQTNINEWIKTDMADIFLKYGDIIDIIAPSHKPILEHGNEIINEVIKIIEKMGFKARIASDIFNYEEDNFCANTVEYRKEKFIEALYNSESKMIWCLQGGYGASNFIADLEKLVPPKHKKILVGFSDITALHIFLNSKWGWPSIHYRNLSQFCNKNNENISNEEITNFKDFIVGNIKELSYDIISLNKVKFEGEGEVIGGNLSIISCSIGTNWQIQAENKILFVEEVDERGYAIDRMFYHLEQAGIFKNLKALLVGDIICNPEEDGEKRCDLAIKNLCSRLDIPIFKINNCGHDKENVILPLNVKCKIINNELQYVF
jgi:muramoyltetrapeptide carboxypeptidase